MTAVDAVAFLERVESDQAFARELEGVRGDAKVVLEKVHAAGFDATPEEIRDAFTERYGAQLTSEQLAQIAAGTDSEVWAYSIVGTTVVVMIGAVAAAL